MLELQGLHRTWLHAGQGLLCLPASGWEDGSALLSLWSFIAELVAAKVAERHESCSLKDAKWHFMEDEGKALIRQGCWEASAPQAMEPAVRGDTSVVSQHQLLPLHPPVQQLRCQQKHHEWLRCSRSKCSAELSFLLSLFRFPLNCQPFLPSLCTAHPQDQPHSVVPQGSLLPHFWSRCF